ncbi:hypothetical protein MKEN_01403800 [Mycena kentingensis (nom. inval.)]|nr:hypothetical protein MKEN_01403800 [Mycena kentingensis (nom. inval.)]
MSHSHDDSSSSMDMGSTSTDTGTTSDSMSMMMMKAYLHFTPGDTLIFDTLTPTSAGAVFGACLVLFVIAVGERALLAASRGWAQGRAARSQRLLRAYEFSGDAKDGTAPATPAPAPRRTPFILTHELSRGFLAGAQMTLHYLLMLVVMTFNAAFIISVLLGVFVGEVAFGRLYR